MKDENINDDCEWIYIEPQGHIEDLYVDEELAILNRHKDCQTSFKEEVPHYSIDELYEHRETYEDVHDSDEIDCVIIEQMMIDAKLIDLSDELIQFPWHGRPFKDFADINYQLQKSIQALDILTDEESVNDFIKKNTDLYKAYFQNPICVVRSKKNPDMYTIDCDGRHRIFAAQLSNGYIPVNHIEYCSIKNLTYEEYVTCAWGGPWRFFTNERTPWNGMTIAPEIYNKLIFD